MVTSKPKVIDSFRGKYAFLSNLYPSPLHIDGLWYPTAEHAFQAAKTYDEDMKYLIAIAGTPAIAKRIGRSVELIDRWEEVKEQVMRHVLGVKFHDKDLRKRLFKTYPAILIEGNTWGDTYWGVCRGEGLNRLGTILMDVRNDIRERT